MVPPPSHRRRTPAFTLLEMTVVICVLMVLIGIGLMANNAIKSWRAGREAAESLRSVYSAQRMFLADHPTTEVGTLTAELLIPYLPDRAAAFPAISSLEGDALVIDVTVSPPVLTRGGAIYDPSGSNNDNLWDVGE